MGIGISIEAAKFLLTVIFFVALCVLVLGATLAIFFYLCSKFKKAKRFALLQFKNDDDGLVIKIDDNFKK